MPYQVLDWDRHFENNKSRERDSCRFVCVPNKQDGLGLTHILAEPDGAAIYGIFQLVIGALSRQRRPRAGWLTVDGHQAGTPWALSDLALRWRRSVSEIERALEVLCSERVGWISGECPPSAQQVPAECPGMEGKGREGKGKESPPPPSGEAEAVMEAWNRMAETAGLPQVKMLSAGRRKHLLSRLRETAWRGVWAEAIAQVPTVPALCGRNDRGWKANFDWFLRPESVAKLVEGRYSNWKLSPEGEAAEKFNAVFGDLQQPDYDRKAQPAAGVTT